MWKKILVPLFETSAVTRLLRILLPAGIFLVTGLSLLFLFIEQSGWVPDDFATVTLTVFISLIWTCFSVSMGKKAYFIEMEHDRLQQEHARELKSIADELARSNEHLKQFAYVASHDLQAPLRKIIGFGEMLEEEVPLNENGLHYVSTMRQAATRMSELITALLNYSRIGSQDLTLEELDLNDIVKTVLDDLQTIIEETRARIDCQKLPRLRADAVQMRQLFQNLIGNALKFHKPDTPPVIQISLNSDLSGKSLISIRDNGIGFDTHQASRIFQPFQRLNPGKEYPGTGIGLAVCKRIVERHGGTLTVESSPGQGSCFTFSLNS